MRTCTSELLYMYVRARPTSRNQSKNVKHHSAVRIAFCYFDLLLTSTLAATLPRTRTHIPSTFTMSASDASKAESAKPATDKPTEPQQKPAAQLEEDDEFEDFPVEGLLNRYQEVSTGLTRRCRLGKGGRSQSASSKHTSVGRELG